MTKKNLLFAMALCLPILTLSACSKAPSSALDSSQGQKSNSSSGSGADRRPDFGQPDRQADVNGIVKSIVGNEVTILKVDFGGRRASSTDAASSTKGDSDSNNPSVNLSLGGTGTRTGGFRAGGQGGGPDGGPGGASSETRAQMMEKLKAMSTGEEKIIIPVGIKMLKSSGQGQDRTMVEAALSDVTSDKRLMIWLNVGVTDRKVAEFVLIN